MCEKAKKYFDILRENEKYVMMFLGFGIAYMFYSDFKDFTKRSQEIQTEQTIALKEITMRLTNLENKVR